MSVDRVIRRAARRHGVRSDVLRRLIQAESGGNPNAVSPAGARGIAQFMPATAKQYGVNLGDGRVEDDIEGAARFLADNLRQFGGDYGKALAAYNAGPGAVQKYGGVPPYKETQAYVKKILGGASPQGSPQAKRPRGGDTVTRTIPGKTSEDVAGALVDAMLSGRKGALARAAALLDTGQYTTTTPARKVTERAARATSQAAPRGSTKGGIDELFYNGPGALNYDQGKRVKKGYVDGHEGHVHIGFKSETARQRAVALAKEMGVSITSEGGGKHAPGSFHYQRFKDGRSKGIDFAHPDPKVMAAFARRVALGS